MRRWLALAIFLAGCGGEPAPESFVIAIRFVSIEPAIVESLRLSFRPETGETFAAQEETEHEDGRIRVRVGSDGVLVMEIDGDHVREHATRPDGSQWIYLLSIWSDDPAMNEGPLVLGSAQRSGESIGQGSVYLPSWPPPPEERAQLAIECSREAASAGLCTP